MPMGIDEKHLVAHLCTLCQKVLSLEMEPALGVKRSTQSRRRGATSDFARLWHRWGVSPAPGGLRGLMRAKAPWPSAWWGEKWVDVDRDGVNQYPNHRRESRGWKGSPSRYIGERHHCECLWLGLLQCISSDLGTEKDINKWTALAWMVLNSLSRRQMFPL